MTLKLTLTFLLNKDWYVGNLIFKAVDCVVKTIVLAQPFYAGTWVVQLLCTNLALGATFSHLLIWNYDDMRAAWSWMSPSRLKIVYQSLNLRFWTDDGVRKQIDNGEIDPHYREMLKVFI